MKTVGDSREEVMMRRTILVMTALAFVGCAGGGEEMPADTPATAMAAPLSLADLAGTWNLQTISESGDTVASVLTGTGDASSWTIAIAGRDPIPARVMVDGDSVITESGPFESVLRPGVMVTTHTVSRLDNGMLMGNIVVRYEGAGADSVMRGTVHGTRVP
jgi:hypothetical protein